MINNDEIKALNILRLLVKSNSEKIQELYREIYKQYSKDEFDIKADILSLGVFVGFKNAALKTIASKYNKQLVLQSLLSTEKSCKYNISCDNLSTATLYHVYYIQSEFLKYMNNNQQRRELFSDNVSFIIKKFVAQLKKPEYECKGLWKLSSSLNVENNLIYITDEDTKFALNYCENNLLNFEPEMELDSALIHVGYDLDGKPIYSKSLYSSKKYYADGKTRFNGKNYVEVGKDNEPKEYVEPKGYDFLPYETEKDVL